MTDRLGPYVLLGHDYEHPVVEWDGRPHRAPTGFIPGLARDADKPFFRLTTVDDEHGPDLPALMRCMIVNNHVQDPEQITLAVDIWRPGETRRGCGISLGHQEVEALVGVLWSWHDTGRRVGAR